MRYSDDIQTQIEVKSQYPEDVSDWCQPGNYFWWAVNIWLGELARKGINGLDTQVEAIIRRMAFSIELGGYLYLMHPAEGAQWTLCLKHSDGTDEGLITFRRRKVAEQFIGVFYLFALDKIRNCK